MDAISINFFLFLFIYKVYEKKYFKAEDRRTLKKTYRKFKCSMFGLKLIAIGDMSDSRDLTIYQYTMLSNVVKI